MTHSPLEHIFNMHFRSKNRCGDNGTFNDMLTLHYVDVTKDVVNQLLHGILIEQTLNLNCWIDIAMP